MPHVWAGEGVIHEGVIYEKCFIANLCMKGCPWVTQNRRFKKIFILHLQPKSGLYTKGVIHERVMGYLFEGTFFVVPSSAII